MHQYVWQVTSTYSCIQLSSGLWERIPSMNLIASKCCYVTPNQCTSILPLKMRSIIVSAIRYTYIIQKDSGGKKKHLKENGNV